MRILHSNLIYRTLALCSSFGDTNVLCEILTWVSSNFMAYLSDSLSLEEPASFKKAGYVLYHKKRDENLAKLWESNLFFTLEP